ncbi:MAG: HPr family phosphocarrier protein [Lachnospiraceae bacterium]|nr:HPr family phosphocarrier protein [Lachnospiraceae bacterium]
MVIVGIKLDLVESVKKLAEVSMKYDFDIDVKSEKYMVSAKSILGVMGIASNKVMELRIEASAQEAEKFLTEISEMLVGNPAQG